MKKELETWYSVDTIAIQSTLAITDDFQHFPSSIRESEGQGHENRTRVRGWAHQGLSVARGST